MDPLKNPAAEGARKKAFSLAEEFKSFAFKGSVIDLAVGVIIGAAFNSIITSMVNNIVMPLISLVLPADNSYKAWAFGPEGKPVHYGQFIADVLNFLLVALVLFIFVVKFLGWIMRAKKQEAAAPPPLTRDQELLTEIRDLLKAEQQPKPA